jgi:peptide/nickel transport system substrate-binding protein
VDQQRVDAIRYQRSELENHVIDEFFKGSINRREFVRRAAVLGMGMPTIGAFLAACGTSSAATNTGVTPRKGGHLTVAVISPAGKVDPISVADEGGLAVLGQSGEYLAFSDKDLMLQPTLATSWSSNADASVWTFKIRQGVKFQDGTTMTAADVAATLNLHADPATGSNALSVFKGVLSKGGAAATDAQTVTVTLDAPNGSFPYLVSSDNYNLIILPASYSGNYAATFPGTGPWKMTSFTTGSGVSYAKNPSYWNTSQPLLDSMELKFYADDQSRITSLLGGTSDVVSQFSAATGQSLLNNSTFTILGLRSSAHRQIHMRTDTGPFTNKLVRQAMALVIKRTDLVGTGVGSGLLNGKAEVGNDSPFAPIFPFTDTSVPQRAYNLAMAQQLMSQAGKSAGFAVTLYTWRGFEIPDLAVAVQSAAKAININITNEVDDAGTYYDKYWLNSPLGITDYGHRGVPNVFLTAPLQSTGTWNSAHFANSDYDTLTKQYVAAVDLTSQKRIAKQIETLLLDQTPIIFAYFYYHMTASKKTVVGLQPTAMGHINVKAAGFVSGSGS